VPTDQAAAVRDELAASIESTLVREAQHNERLIAAVRASLMPALCIVEVIFALSPGGIDWPWRVPTFFMLLWSVGLLQALRTGWFHRSLPVIVPAIDATYVLIRIQSTYSFHSLEVLQDSMELASAVVAACIVVLTGAFRLRRTSLIATTALGLFLYLWFALQSDLFFGQVITQAVLLLGVGGMAYGLTQQVRRAVRSEVARQTLTRFLPASMIDEMHEDPLALLTKARSVRATVLISDIRGFTAWAEDKEPMQVLGFLNVIQGALADIVREHHGTVDKFMGDGMLAVFGAPEDLDDHANQAVLAAKQMRIAAQRINDSTEGADVRIGIGIHSGELVVGCLGSGVRMEFTVLGDTVNTASRLESMTKSQGVDVLISTDSIDEIGANEGLSKVGEVDIRGRKEPMVVWTLTG